MDVFLLPIGSDRYEPYCEVADEEPVPDAAGPKPGYIRGLWHRFRAMLAAAERERREGTARHPESWPGRLRDRIFRWAAERIAEQRLLWHLRRQQTARLVHPSDLDGEQALAILRAVLQRDADRHRLWLVVHAVLFIASGVFFFVPGPNLIAYYFAFRLVGHYLSMRGARHGIRAVAWDTQPSDALADLRPAISLDPAQRQRHVVDVASRLRLQHLARFFERVALRSA